MNGIEKKEQAFDPFKFLIKYFKYWPFIFGSVLLFSAMAFFHNMTTPPIYQVEGKFFIKDESNANGILNLTGLNRQNALNLEQWVVNQAIFLKSKPVSERALARLDFNVDYFEPGMFTDTEIYKASPIHVEVDWNHAQILADKIKISWTDSKTFKVSFPGSSYYHYIPGSAGIEIDISDSEEFSTKFQEFTDNPLLRIKVTMTKNLPEGEVLIELRSKGSLLSQYTGDNFQVFAAEQMSSVLSLSLIASHPEKGSDYLNSLMEVFLDMELEEKNRIARNTVDFIDSQIEGVQDTLSRFEDNLQSFRSSNRTYDVASESNTVFQKMTILDTELSRERVSKVYFDELISYLQKGSFEQIIAPSGLGISDPTLNSLISNLITLQSERSNLLFSQTEASPRVREISRKIQDVSSSILELVRNLSNSSQMKINELENRINSINQQFSRLPSTEQNLVRIQRGRNLNESIYNFLQQRRAEAAISMASTFAANKIVEYARPSSEPIQTKRTAWYLLLGIFGFIFPIVLLFIRDLVDKKVNDAKDLEDSINVPLVAKIPLNKHLDSLAVLNEPRSAIAESFRALKTNLSFVVPLNRQLTLAVSSTLAGEGKTFVAINLASIYAMNQKKTILISCDMFKPNAMRGFELERKIGLSNYLSEQVDSIFEIIQSSKYPNLDIIYAGVIPPNPSDLLGSERFGFLIEQLKPIYDVIVLDTPPVGLISQSLEVTKHVDLITFVLRYNFSEKSFVDDLNDLKSKKGLQNVYAILNAIPEKELTYKGYDYGYYETRKTKKTESPVKA
ncbi:GumC family protein [Aquiflexum gelatinilyticum]|uniref:non-specific protein-tyrosine kinase n=1 Tax=Aquiflexum gelatinilyticum TaxID=2961943 RepID=A0A9X2P5Q4_9BACT|nr:polysaccharide biosynthesis tyrosine autokinase [Aquiflexum gelatinilyticum]MCR9016493.1 polysaccharide biosynthesis tyrosine autokinase [Aquiflexum gelatinilyticum]